MKNPFEIAPGTVFISGALKLTSGIENHELTRAEAIIEKNGLKAFNPANHPECADPKKRLACMLMCDQVATVGDWQLDEVSSDEVRVARIYGIPVSLINLFELKNAG